MERYLSENDDWKEFLVIGKDRECGIGKTSDHGFPVDMNMLAKMDEDVDEDRQNNCRQSKNCGSPRLLIEAGKPKLR